MTTTSITPDQDTVVSEIDIAAPPARVTPHHRPLGTRAHKDGHACESHPQRPGPRGRIPQGLLQRLARRDGHAEKVRRKKFVENRNERVPHF